MTRARVSTELFWALVCLLVVIAVAHWNKEGPCSVRDVLDARVQPSPYFLRDPVAVDGLTQRGKLESIARTLECVARIFHSERWFVSGGTLLGAHRHDAMLPFDKDGDVILPFDDYQRLIARLRALNVRQVPPFYSAKDRVMWDQVGHRLVLYSDGKCAVTSRGNWTAPDTVLPLQVIDIGVGFSSDVWIGHIVPHSLFRRYESGRWLEMPLGDVFPLQRATLGRLSVPVPRNVPLYLKQSYGDIQHPYTGALQLYVRLPSAALSAALVVALLPSWIAVVVRKASQHRARWFYALLGVVCAAATAVLLTSLQCTGVFAVEGFFFAVATVSLQRGAGQDSGPLLAKCSVLLAMTLALLCVFSVRTWLAMLVDNYEFGGREGDQRVRAWLLDSPLFDIDYRQFWNGINQ
jgi:hypothetical protein